MRGRSIKSKAKPILSLMKNGLPFNSCFATGLILGLLFISPALAADPLCAPAYHCGPTSFCKDTVSKISYTAFQAWLNDNQYRYYEIVYANASIVWILYRTECYEKEVCWDASGTCVETIQP